MKESFQGRNEGKQNDINKRRIKMSNNLVGYTKGCKSFNVCKTWKNAQALARQWNKDFQNNGRQKVKIL